MVLVFRTSRPFSVFLNRPRPPCPRRLNLPRGARIARATTAFQSATHCWVLPALPPSSPQIAALRA